MRITLEGTAVSAVVGALDLGLEHVAGGVGPLSYADVGRTAITLGAAAADYANLVKDAKASEAVATAFYAELPLFEKTIYAQARRLMGGTSAAARAAGVRAAAVRAAASGLQQFQNPALAGSYRSISA